MERNNLNNSFLSYNKRKNFENENTNEKYLKSNKRTNTKSNINKNYNINVEKKNISNDFDCNNNKILQLNTNEKKKKKETNSLKEEEYFDLSDTNEVFKDLHPILNDKYFENKNLTIDYIKKHNLPTVDFTGKNEGMNIFISKPQELKNEKADIKQKIHTGLSNKKLNKYNIISNNKVNYNDALKLHELWKTYVDEMCNVTKTDILSFEILKDLELNGAFVEIFKSQCSTYLGLKGIIILETQNTFDLVTPKNKILIILKNKTVFIIKIKNRKYYLHGIQLIRDPALKSFKKYKVLQNRHI